MCGLNWRQQEAGHCVATVGCVTQHAWAWLQSLSSLLTPLTATGFYLTSGPATHQPPVQSSSSVSANCKSFHQETAIKQVLTSLSLHKMMQSDNNLPARLRVKFYLSFRNVAQLNRITIALLLFPLKRHLKLEMDFTTIKLFCDWPVPSSSGWP